MAVFGPQIRPEAMFWPQIQPAVKCRQPSVVAQGLTWLGGIWLPWRGRDASRSGCATCMSMALAAGVGSFSGGSLVGGRHSLAASVDLKRPVRQLPV